MGECKRTFDLSKYKQIHPNQRQHYDVLRVWRDGKNTTKASLPGIMAMHMGDYTHVKIWLSPKARAIFVTPAMSGFKIFKRNRAIVGEISCGSLGEELRRAAIPMPAKYIVEWIEEHNGWIARLYEEGTAEWQRMQS